MKDEERQRAAEYLRVAANNGWLWCANCDGRKCMGCVSREWDHECEDDCPMCCGADNVHYSYGPTFGSVLRQGWDRET